ncbi:MAG: YggT family protein [Candidatus Dormibacteraeota bacterium]|nr:YggT family protein [Candidatus Dormibacteraeota bacterium]
MSVAVASTAINVINIVSVVLYVLILARILISWLPIHPWHPLVRWLRIIVDPILAPFRRILPSVAGLDLSPLLAILVIFFIAHLATGAIAQAAGFAPLSIPALVVSLIAQLIEAVIIILGVLVLLRLLLSLFSADPFHPLVAGIRSMTNPLVRPFAGFGRRRALTGLDVPALLTLILYVILYVVVEIVFNRLLVSVL